ncbi:MAG: RHS repeat domain-containing protein [Luteibaculaceae bacterium]
MVYQTNRNSSIIEVRNITDYYPFGKELRFYKGEPNEKFLSTQHERDRASSYDHRQARNSTSEFGVFLSVDPLAFKMPSWTPYHYTFNNPISFTDPNGMEPQVYVDGMRMFGPINYENFGEGSIIESSSGGTIKQNSADPEKLINRILEKLPEEQRQNARIILEKLQELSGFNWAKVGIGLETNISYKNKSGLLVEAALIAGNVMFLGGDDAGYVYTYYGGEGGLGGITDIGVSAEVSFNAFITYNHSGNLMHKDFHGEYLYYASSVGISTGLTLGGFDIGVNLYGGMGVGQNWTTYYLGRGLSGGAGLSPFDISYVHKGKGRVSFFDAVGSKNSILTTLSWAKWLILGF